MVILLAVLAVLVLGGTAIAAAMGTTGLIDAIVSGLPVQNVAQAMFAGLESFTLLAIPLFILTGEILHRSGAADRLVAFVNACVAWLPGGLGISVVGSTMVFSGLSGSVNADAAAIGSTMLPPMERAGYRREWSASIVAASSGTGVLIPPSITIIVLATVANLSVTELFLAALLPAAVVAISKVIVILWYARFVEPPVERVAPGFGALGRAFGRAVPALVAPLVILGGIFSGTFTATEAAAIAVLYSTLLALAYRTIPWREWGGMLVRVGKTSGVVLVLVGVAQILAYMLAYDRVEVSLADWASGFTGNYLLFTLVLIVVFWIIGALLDGMPALIVLAPLFLPLAQEAGMSPLHFAVLALAIIGISLVTPPLGTACFIVSGIANVSMARLVKPMAPFIVIMFVTMILLAYVPGFAEWLPGLYGE
ncbi:TRAP transporter large permease [Actinomadura darangshiensis]|uniref:TRAP transporter large permease n=1 Tax=Actinomadura darangshiensis TaxID=705336 RepID=A0A4R5BAI8_9ACTN|nr:TRAP transporter large permease [Actinomadura darangshiensis]